VGSLLLVALGRHVVLLLVLLVTERIHAGAGTRAQRGIAVLGNVLVGLLGSTSGSACRETMSVSCSKGRELSEEHTLNLVRDVVGGVLDGIHFG
jgi:hypothetical protein